MKKLLFSSLFAIALFACGETAEAVEVPTTVQSAFNAAYPGATDVEWEEDGDAYEVEFMLNGEEMEAEFSALGEEMMVEED
ncbi:hypothetical protein CLV84_2098 [Neolewinella xylanilytica]|uniref:YpeB-like protein with protease inhibitory function n=1 Tax=Neolewinella xylanilytica TaxID=1514080 RepID=A0A2S6I203_9BACT|nr:hypothetical protein [Neolewinella xylanilytica]PPK85206.1 hypothetical protein CLV84_2098 [Neolewinella xylanilytica]